jgi:hypothetical protein
VEERKHFTGVRTHIKDVKMAEGNYGQLNSPGNSKG